MATKTKAKPATNGQATKSITIAQLNTKRALIPITGTSELICHAWGPKAIKQMVDMQTGVTKKKARGSPREAKVPDAEYRESLYVIELNEKNFEKSVFGFPSSGFKQAMVRAAKLCGMAMTDAKTSFRVEGDLVVIDGTPHMRQDMVRLQGKTADVRFRGAFKDWSAVLPIVYDEDIITVEDIVNLVQRAGFSVGVGEWRQERGGNCGAFAVSEEGFEIQ